MRTEPQIKFLCALFLFATCEARAASIWPDCTNKFQKLRDRAQLFTRNVPFSGKSAASRLSDPLIRFKSDVHEIDFKISSDQIHAAQNTVDRDLLNETLFVVPDNDGEARRANEILRAIDAPHLQTSHQAWGATLRNEYVDLFRRPGVKRVVLFEIPGAQEEELLRRQGFDVVTIDHHAYQDLDRRRPESSLEQLMSLIRWPMSRTDEALAVNDRGYIPGLKKMGLSEEEIRKVRAFDLVSQGRTPKEVEELTHEARMMIPKIPKKDGVYILDHVEADETILKQEIAIQSPDGLASALVIKPSGIGFSGDPAVAQRLLKANFEELGYEKGSYAQYGGGDPNASMFFGFKPKKPPKGEKELLTKRVLDRIESMLQSDSRAKLATVAAEDTELEPEVKASGMLPLGSAIITSSGELSKSGIRHIIHAATGSMSQRGPKFDPTLKSVIASVKNSLTLARENGHKRVAVPFIGGKIFVERIGVSSQELADRIVESAIKNRGDLELRFVTFGEEDTRLFKNALSKFVGSLKPGEASVISGSITDSSLHGATAIVNAANMEAQFGGGLSGAIGKASGRSREIDQEAQDKIREFYQSAKPGR